MGWERISRTITVVGMALVLLNTNASDQDATVATPDRADLRLFAYNRKTRRHADIREINDARRHRGAHAR